MVAPASSFVSTRTTAAPSFKAPQDTTTDSATDTERGRAGFYRREEQRQQEDDVEEEDALVPTLHVGARSPYTVGGLVCGTCLVVVPGGMDWICIALDIYDTAFCFFPSTNH